jgi:flagellar biosynthetic protein FliR
MSNISFLMQDIFLLGLVLSRVSGFAYTAPFISDEQVPGRIRFLFCFLFSLTLMPSAGINAMKITNASFFFNSPLEFGIGALIGMGLNLAVWALKSAGEEWGHMVGMRFTDGIDIDMDKVGLGELFWVFTGLIILSTGGDRLMLSTFAKLYEKVPAGAFRMGIVPLEPAFRYGEAFFLAVLKLSMPVIGVMIMFYLMAGIFEHFFPNWDLFAVVFPAAIMLGIWCLFVISPQLITLFMDIFEEGFSHVARSF